MLLYNSRARRQQPCPLPPLLPLAWVLGLWMGLDVRSLLRLGIDGFLLLI